MTCPKCGTHNDPGAKFCEECGTALAAACPSCGSQINPGAKFCQNCGTALTATPMAPQPAAQSERKLVTVLFADLVGFTPFAEERDAEDVRDTLTRYFDLAREVIDRYGGTVEKFIGDAVMAVWGAPVIREDDAELAVRAALELVDAVTSLGPSIQARAGVLTGQAAVTIGATNQGMVAGDLVNTASRLQGVAPPASVLVGESTQRAASAAIVFEPVGEQVLRGKELPLPAWRAVRVVGERGGRNRSDQLEAPFVGRQEELRLLKDLFHATGRESKLRVVSAVGPAGIGKSRLSWEFSKYLDGLVEPIYWHRGRSPAYGQGITFWALGEMVRERAGLAEQDDDPTTRAKIAAQVEEWVSDHDERASIERALLTLLGVESGMASDELFGAWRTFFERIAQKGTVVLLFEDMHFADTGSLDFIDHLLDWSRGLPIYVVTLSRPDLIDRRPTWGAGKRNFVSLYLEPLPDADMRELLAGLVPGLPDRAVGAIVARADGIPLYAIETVRSLIADGRVVERDGAYAPVGDLTNLAVPETLTSVIAARLDALDETDRRVVHDAAVLGQSFTLDALSAVLEQSAENLEPRLAGLVRRELFRLEMDPRSPERGQYEFVQALIREVAYNTLSRKDRKRLHLAAARYLESIGSDEIAGALAAHYLAAHGSASEVGDADALASQARIALKAAAARAESLGSFGQAMVFLDQAVGVTRDPLDQAALLVQAGDDARTNGMFDESELHLRRAIALGEQNGDPNVRARATTVLGRVLLNAYRAAEARALLASALDDLPEAGEEERTGLRMELAHTLHALNEDDTAYPILDDALGTADQRGWEGIVGEGFFVKASTLWALRRRREAMAIITAAVDFAARHGLTDVLLRSLNAMSSAQSEFDMAAGVESFRETIAAARRSGRKSELVIAVSSFGYLGFLSGNWDEALAAMEELLADDLEPRNRLVLLNNVTLIRSSRGEPIDEQLAEMERSGEGMSGHWRMFIADTTAERAMALGDYKAASRGFLDVFEAQPGESEYIYRIGRAEVLGRDIDEARQMLSKLIEMNAYGVIADARRESVEAGIAAAEGRTGEAIELYRAAMAQWRSSGSAWDEALTGVDMALLLDPSNPDVTPFIASTREILVRLRAQPYLDRLDAAVASGQTASSGADAGSTRPGIITVEA